MKEIIIEGALIDSREELHRIFQEALGISNHYGKNLDALWDVLTGEIDLPIRIIWRDFNITEKNIGAYAVKTSKVIERASEMLVNKIFYTIEE
ncbi:barstar family protein [Alloiococcus sp. CFN-8]|uniref:barstar family protein n=1 Tax=Alloiococcus sp. CFN-8 TaxID=3416081 RepID=UPI003CEDD99E